MKMSLNKVKENVANHLSILKGLSIMEKKEIKLDAKEPGAVINMTCSKMVLKWTQPCAVAEFVVAVKMATRKWQC
ncbi:hypothetical protein NC651_038359 [Populus alba x Populus x berolinensis]|nr:hypothetical protein NC651_038359 [Populus alba x Populus x berolinensis]